MGLRFRLFVVATAAIAHSIFCLADREIRNGVDHLSEPSDETVTLLHISNSRRKSYSAVAERVGLTIFNHSS